MMCPMRVLDARSDDGEFTCPHPISRSARQQPHFRSPALCIRKVRGPPGIPVHLQVDNRDDLDPGKSS